MSESRHRRVEKVVVIGGSLGAIEVLQRILADLPADFPAAIFVVIHVSVDSSGHLPDILARTAKLQVKRARDGETMRPQTVYVAPPDHHVTLEDHRMCVQRGPRENRHRPAIDPLYRTTARTFGRNAIAVLLTGNLDDGSVGMLAIRTLGGYGIVQDPSEAEASSMPRSALQYAGADSVLPAREIAPKLIELIDSRVPAMKKSKHSSRKKNNPDRETRANEETSSAKEGNGKPSVFACPECHGVLWELKNGSLSHYRCRVGHSYTGASLKVELDQSSERALWVAMRTLEEKAAMTQRMIDGTNGPRDYVRRLKEQMESDRGNAQVIRKMIFASE